MIIQLRGEFLSEEVAADLFQPPLKVIINAVPGDIEETRLAAGARDLSGGVQAIARPGHQRPDVI